MGVFLSACVRVKGLLNIYVYIYLFQRIGENGSFKDHCGSRDHVAAQMLKRDGVLKIIIFRCGLLLVRAVRRAIRQRCDSSAGSSLAEGTDGERVELKSPHGDPGMRNSTFEHLGNLSLNFLLMFKPWAHGFCSCWLQLLHGLDL